MCVLYLLLKNTNVSGVNHHHHPHPAINRSESNEEKIISISVFYGYQRMFESIGKMVDFCAPVLCSKDTNNSVMLDGQSINFGFYGLT